MSSARFRDEYLQCVLDLLWAQWCVLGIAGHSKGLRGDCVDPEALILATCRFGRYDQRLFDAMMEWLCLHEDLVSSQRLSSLVRKDPSDTARVLKAVAAHLFLREKKHKWRRFTADDSNTQNAVPFFVSQMGIPLAPDVDRDPIFMAQGFIRAPVEKRSQLVHFDWTHPSSLWIRLRAFMGVSSRTEICVYLMTHEDGGHPTLIARTMGYAQGGFQQSLVSMCESGWVLRSERRHEVIYVLAESIREAFSRSLHGRPYWLTWSRFFHVLEVLWQALSIPGFSSLSSEAQSAELRSAMQKSAYDLGLLGFSGEFLEQQHSRGAEFVSSLRASWLSLFDRFHEKEPAI